jgi:hypothetical protein
MFKRYAFLLRLSLRGCVQEVMLVVFMLIHDMAVAICHSMKHCVQHGLGAIVNVLLAQ